MVWVWDRTSNCAEMSRLASLSFEQTPSLKTGLKMRLHYFICVWCERYAKHLKFSATAPGTPALKTRPGGLEGLVRFGI